MTTATATATEDKKAVETPPVGENKLVPIGLLRESPTNPRKQFDDEALQNLADSIKEKGVLQALVVRPLGSGFEIIAGARRYRASRLAGLKDVPVKVFNLTDIQALEVQILENLQREDVTAIDEAYGYRKLLQHGYTVEQLAAKIHKKPRYVYARLELQKLAKEVRDAVEKGRISASHAQVIGRLNSEEDQRKALEACFVKSYDEPADDMLVAPREVNGEVEGLVSVRDLEETVKAMHLGRELIQQKEALDIAGHKTAFITDANWSRQRSVTASGRWKSQGKRACKFPAKGVVVDGPKRGKVLDICLTTNCKEHFKTHPVSGGQTWKPKAPSLKDQLADIRNRLEREVEKVVNEKILGGLMDAGPSLLDRDELERVATTLARRWGFHQGGPIVEAFPFIADMDSPKAAKALSALKDKDLTKLIRGLIWLQASLDTYYAGGDTERGQFHARARELKVDVTAIQKASQAEIEKRLAEEKEKLESAGGLITWKPDPVHHGNQYGKAKGTKQTYVIRKSGKTFGWETRPNYAGASGFDSLEDCKASAEKNARSQVGTK